MTRVAILPGLPWDDGRWACERLRAAGHEAWFVGGCVRDLLLGRDVHDVDVATSAHPEQVAPCFDRVLEVGKSFGVLIAVHPSGRTIEIATFRSDGAYIDGRRPTGVVFATAVEDVHRRDFTINGLLLDPQSGEVVDHVGGLDDLAAKRIRVIDGAGRLAEDRLRVLRGLRFAAHLGFAIEPETWNAILATPLAGLSRERIWQELDKGLSCRPAEWVRFVIEAGKLSDICPFLANDAGLGALAGGTEASRDLSLALLLAPVPDADLFPWLESEPIPRERFARLRWLRAAAAALRENPGIPARRRLLRHADAALLVRYLQCREELPQAVEWLAGEQAAGALPVLVRAGDLLAGGIPPGPAIGRILRAIEDAQLAGELGSRDDALALAARLAGR